jgi:predicted nucleic acid-binding protein
MNIFIDTSVVYTDPFWKRNFATQILDAAKDNRITVFIADLVIKELRHNLKRKLG